MLVRDLLIHHHHLDINAHIVHRTEGVIGEDRTVVLHLHTDVGKSSRAHIPIRSVVKHLPTGVGKSSRVHITTKHLTVSLYLIEKKCGTKKAVYVTIILRDTDLDEET